MSDYHESWDALPERSRNIHRACRSLAEEVDAVDWYDQRVALTEDAELRAVLAHNRDEEIEHAAMTLEWLRRHMDGWDEKLRLYLFTDTPLLEIEGQAEEAACGDGVEPGGDLGIGSMKGEG